MQLLIFSHKRALSSSQGGVETDSLCFQLCSIHPTRALYITQRTLSECGGATGLADKLGVSGFLPSWKTTGVSAQALSPGTAESPR